MPEGSFASGEEFLLRPPSAHHWKSAPSNMRDNSGIASSLRASQ